MSDRRPSRIRKPVNYSGFDDTSDDDFANNTPPPTKKPKAEVKNTKSKISKSSPREGQKESFTASNNSTPILDSGKKRRLPVSEKIYERELKEALQISLFETGGSQDVIVHNEDHGSSMSAQEQNLKACNDDFVQETFSLTKKLAEQELEKNKAVTGQRHNNGMVGTVMDDSIEVLGSDIDNDNNKLHSNSQLNPATRQTKKKLNSYNECDDGDLDQDDESEIDESSSSGCSSEDNYSDFDEKPKKKTIATKNTKSNPQSTPKPKKNSKPSLETVATNLPKANLKDNISSSIKKSEQHHTVQLSSGTVKRSTAKSPSTPIVSAKASPNTPPTWKPPSRASSGSSSLTSVKSPTTGLRLGLSRNQMIKPLHKSFKVACD